MLLTGTDLAKSPDIEQTTGQQTGTVSSASDTGSEAPPQPDEQPLTTVADYQAAIENREAEGGAYDITMSEMLYGLARTLQGEGEHAEAVDIFRHAMHINRVNNGIYDISQEPMLRGMIDSQIATDNINQATLLYNQLLQLYYEAHGETAPELLPVLEEIANWHQEVYLNNRSNDRIGHLIWSISLSDTAVNIADQQPASIYMKVVGLLRNLAASNWYMIKHYKKYHTFSPPEHASFNPNVRTKLIRQVNSSNVSAHEKIEHYGFIHGREAYERIITILNDNNATPQQRASALVELGDWFSIHKRKKAARESYGKAWHLLKDDGDLKTLKRLLGSPDKLPNFLGDSSKIGNRVVKIVLDIDKNGRVDKTKVLETYPPNDKQAASQAVKSMKRALFRPRYEDGKPADTEGHTINLTLHD